MALGAAQDVSHTVNLEKHAMLYSDHEKEPPVPVQAPRDGPHLMHVEDIGEVDYESLPTHNLWQHLVAGAMAGMMEHCCMYPVDCVKVRNKCLGCAWPLGYVMQGYVCFSAIRVVMNLCNSISSIPSMTPPPFHPWWLYASKLASFCKSVSAYCTICCILGGDFAEVYFSLFISCVPQHCMQPRAWY